MPNLKYAKVIKKFGYISDFKYDNPIVNEILIRNNCIAMANGNDFGLIRIKYSQIDNMEQLIDLIRGYDEKTVKQAKKYFNSIKFDFKLLNCKIIHYMIVSENNLT